MNLLNDFFKSIWITRIFHSIIVIIISIIIYKLIARLLTKNNNLFTSKKSKTFTRLTKSIIRYILIIITTLIVLQINGINVSSMLAGVGIIGIIIGFAIQDALKDIIKGFDIISDTYYQVGDIIKFNNIEGKVITIGLKTTKIEDIKTFNIISISNRNIEQVEIVSNLINIDIPFPYEIKLKDAENVISDIIANIKKIENVTDCKYHGINEFASSSLNYHIKVYCNPYFKLQTRRNVLTTIISVFEKNNISIPYNQIDIHQK